jgi:hypothetical protein
VYGEEDQEVRTAVALHLDVFDANGIVPGLFAANDRHQCTGYGLQRLIHSHGAGQDTHLEQVSMRRSNRGPSGEEGGDGGDGGGSG